MKITQPRQPIRDNSGTIPSAFRIDNLRKNNEGVLYREHLGRSHSCGSFRREYEHEPITERFLSGGVGSKDDSYTFSIRNAFGVSPENLQIPSRIRRRGFILVSECRAPSPTSKSIYENITLKYAILVKQFVTQIAFAKLSQLVLQQTTDALKFMCADDTEELHRINSNCNMYSKILLEHFQSQTPEIWDTVFSEHNVEIPLLYYADIYGYLLSSDADSFHVYSYETVCSNLDIQFANVYLPETLEEYTRKKHSFAKEPKDAYLNYLSQERRKRICNSVIYDMFIYAANLYGWRETNIPASHIYAATLHRIHSVFNPQPFYVYLEHIKQTASRQGLCLVNSQGHLEITESTIARFVSILGRTRNEIYTIWLIHIWLSPTITANS
jgi:hypothetical protein